MSTNDPLCTLRELLRLLDREPFVPVKGKLISKALQAALDELERRQYDLILAVLAIHTQTHCVLDRELAARLRGYLNAC